MVPLYSERAPAGEAHSALSNAMLKRDAGFATQDAAKIVGRKENEKHAPA
jgi:hypothetical protein